MILPVPKKVENLNLSIPLNGVMNVLVNDEYGEMALKILNELVSEIDVVFSKGENSNVKLVLNTKRFDKSEAYSIEFFGQNAVLTYGDAPGARNAIISLYGLITKNVAGYVIKGCNISDYPDSEYRGLMLDPGRKYIPVEEIKTTIRQMTISKYNVLRLHFLEVEHNPIKTDIYPELNNTPMQQYTKEQLKEIVAYATLFGLEVIPEIEMPAHGCFILDRMEELKCKTRTVEASRWAMCVGNEKTYEVMGNLLKELAEIFPGEYIHIGTDEIDFYDLPNEKYWPTWDDCDVCDELSRRENLKNKREQFYYFVKRIHKILANLGKKMMMWNDGIDISVSPDLPRDILIEFWRIAEKGRGPVEGCSMQRFLEEGFKVVNAHFPETYLDEYIQEDKLLTWNPKVRPESTDEYKHMIIGGEMCTWGPNVHYDRTLPSGIFIFGDKLWDYSDRVITPEYRQALTRLILGLKTPYKFDVFASLGCCLLPLVKDKKGVPENVISSRSKLEKSIETLDELIENEISGKTAAKEYIDCIEWVILEKYGNKQVESENHASKTESNSIGKNQGDIKIANQQMIVEILRKVDSISRTEIAERLSLSNTSVFKNVDDLITRKIITETRSQTSCVGRKPKILKLNHMYGCIAAIDLGSKDIRIAISDLQSRIIDKVIVDKVETINDYQFERIFKSLDTLLRKYSLTDNLLTIVIGTPGDIDRNTGYFIYAPRFEDFKNVNLTEVFNSRYNVDVIVKNDVNLALFGEYTYGAGKDSNNLLYIYFDMGIGSAMMLDGKIYEGMRGFSGDFAQWYMNMDIVVKGMREGKNQFEKLYGEICWYTVESQIKEKLLSGEKSILWNMVSKIDEINIDYIILGYRANDKLCREVVEEGALKFSCALKNAIDFLDVDKVIIGGIVQKFGEDYIKIIRDFLVKVQPVTPPPIIWADLEDKSTIYGGVGTGIDNAYKKLLSV